VKGIVTPPAPAAPQDIVISSVLVQRAVPVVPGAPVTYGPLAAEYKHDRVSLLATLPDGDRVPVEVIGRVGDVTWFSAWDTVRIQRPGLKALSYGAQSAPGVLAMERVQSASTVALRFEDPADATASWFDLWYSDNGGESWTLVEGGITTREYSWMAPSAPTEDAMLDLVAYDELGVMGSSLTPVFEVMGGTTAVEVAAGPERLALKFAGRNPGRQAQLQLGVSTRGEVTLQVFDLRGAVVRTIASGEFEPGWHPMQWDARDATGRVAEPGLYFLRAKTPRETATSRFVLVR
jgi:hypothetical protein